MSSVMGSRVGPEKKGEGGGAQEQGPSETEGDIRKEAKRMRLALQKQNSQIQALHELFSLLE